MSGSVPGSRKSSPLDKDINETIYDDDFESSLDQALNSASSSYFAWSGHRKVSAAHSSSVVGIQLATLDHNGENEKNWSNDYGQSPIGNGMTEGMGQRPVQGSRNISFDNNYIPCCDDYDDTDYNPLIAGRTSHRSFSLANSGSESMSQKFKKVLRSSLEVLRLVKRELSLELQQTNLEGNLAANVGCENTNTPGCLGERNVSPRLKGCFSTAPNAVSHAKYHVAAFVPVVLFHQFRSFSNLYFLLVAFSQAVPALRIGYLSSYVAPLAFVLAVTMAKEAGDEIARRKRDRDHNLQKYEVLGRPSVLTPDSTLVASQDLMVGDVVRLKKGARVPADMVLLHTSDASGEAFLKTDQLDGETDWKLRASCSATQRLSDISEVISQVSLVVEAPRKDIDKFEGRLHVNRPEEATQTVPLAVDNTLWANTVLASGCAEGIIVYTGRETRSQLNTTRARAKMGLLETELNGVSKALCATVLVLSVALVLLQKVPFSNKWPLDVLRFLILFSTIIPVSLRVNLDLAKSVYASQIHVDSDIPQTVVRTSTIPEDLGRVEYLLTDKTGTLTQNDMDMKKLHVGTVCYAGETLDSVAQSVAQSFNDVTGSVYVKRRDLASKTCDLALVLALCHNVTPSEEHGVVAYQAASPDEIAIVKFCEASGLALLKRDRNSITLLHKVSSRELHFEILYIFPFNSDTKRMGIVVKDSHSGEVWFMEKGADIVMSKIVTSSDWLDEETVNMAREGLRTLVVGRKRLGAAALAEFKKKYEKASLSMYEREANMQRVVAQHLETSVELLGITGVEDKLQHNVKTSIELLRNAGVRIWMLTGDKVETAKCVAISAKLISRGQNVHQITKVANPDVAMTHLESITNTQNSVLLIDGESLAVYMRYFRTEFFAMCILLPAVIACRCTPQQKADIALAIKKATGKRVCCVGDGGNDVSMIQCADVGVGIVGKEGKQASLSADFSIDQFHYLSKLLLWHGRNSYKRSAKLAQFIIHRGLIISVAQAIFSISSSFEPLALYKGWLMVGYSTVYTMAPVFSLTLDKDVDEHLTKLYPELYKELTLGKSLSYKSFFMWVTISLFQGSVIQLLSQKFQIVETKNFLEMVSISFTALVFNELFMVAFTIRTWNKVMFGTIVITFMIYVISVPFLPEYFDLNYVASSSFFWQTILVLFVSLFPVWLIRTLSRKFRPPTYAKVQQN